MSQAYDSNAPRRGRLGRSSSPSVRARNPIRSPSPIQISVEDPQIDRSSISADAQAIQDPHNSNTPETRAGTESFGSKVSRVDSIVRATSNALERHSYRQTASLLTGSNAHLSRASRSITIANHIIVPEPESSGDTLDMDIELLSEDVGLTEASDSPLFEGEPEDDRPRISARQGKENEPDISDPVSSRSRDYGVHRFSGKCTFGTDPLAWCQRSDSRNIARHHYDAAFKWVQASAQRSSVLLFAIPKYRRDGQRNRRWASGMLRIHAMLHKTNPLTGILHRPQQDYSQQTEDANYSWPPASPSFTGPSPPREELRLLTKGLLWETFVDIAMTFLGEDHHNGDLLFVCPLPEVPTYDRTVKSLEMACTGMSEAETQARYVEARTIMQVTNLEDCTFTVRLAPYEGSMEKPPSHSRTENRRLPQNAAEFDNLSWKILLKNGVKYDGQTAKTMWDTLEADSDVDLHGHRPYQLQWPATRAQDGRDNIFTLRDGCIEDGDALLSIGISIRIHLGYALGEWKTAQPYLRYYDETDGFWKSKDFVPDTHPTSFVVTHHSARRIIFVIGDKNVPGSWIKPSNGDNFHIAFAGAYEVFTSGHLIRICGSSVSTRLSAMTPQTFSQKKEDENLKRTLASGVDFFSLVDTSLSLESFDYIPPQS